MLLPRPHGLSVRLLLLPVLLGLGACPGSSGGGSTKPKIKAPKSGAFWAGTQKIQWVPFDNGKKVTVQVSDDDGATYTDLEVGGKDDGKFTWDTTAHGDGGEYRVRVLSGSKTLTSGLFTLDNTAPVLVLGAPLGGELWGGDREVTWTTTDDNPGTVAIRLSDDSGATFDTVVASAAPDVDVYTWSTAGLPDGTTYRVEVLPRDKAGNLGSASVSTSDFELDNTAPIISLTAPLGGETWGATQQITWDTTDLHPDTVDIFLSVDSGATYSETVALGVPDSGSYDWQTGEAPDGTALRVRVVAIDGAGNDSGPSSSPGDFEIRNVRIMGNAHYRDANSNSVIDAGDQLYLLFDKNVDVSGSAGPADLALAVTGDTLGSGATVTGGAESNSVLVTLGSNPVLRVRGAFDEDDVTAGRPSAIDISPTMSADAIEEPGTGTDAVPSGMKDLTPGFQPASPLTASSGLPYRAKVGDLDGDGDVDLVVANTAGDADRVYLGNGAGGWTLDSSLGADDTRDVALGDVDGDTDLDIVTAANGANRVYLNDGSAGFTDSGQTLGSNDSYVALLVDVDGDGDLDAVFANGSNQGNRVWENDGAGVFTDTLQSLGSSSTVAMAAGDLDGDGDVDLFAGNDGQANRVWRNDGSGTFTAGATTLLTAVQDVALGDVDNDGDLDVCLAVLGQNEVRRNDGTGTFGAPQYLGNNDNRAVRLLDLDADGDLDLCTIKNLDGGRFWINDGTGVFTEDTVRTLSADAVDLVVARIDEDADSDLLVIANLNAHRYYDGAVAGGQPQATLADSAQAIGLWRSGVPSVGDVDQDGDLDVVVMDLDGPNHVLLGDGTGSFTLGTDFGAGGDDEGTLFDFDRDGDLDYLQRRSSANDRLWINDGSGVFTDSGQDLGGTAFVAGDVDGDGDVDLAVTPSGLGVEIWDNDGAGVFTATGDSFTPSSSAYVHFGDLDQDGDVDLYCGGGTTDQLWINGGAGTFTLSQGFANGTSSGSALVVDVDADGDLDILRSTNAGGVTVARNDGTLTFTTVGPSGPGNQWERMQALDRDEDGDLDLFVNEGGLYAVLLGNGAGTFNTTAQSATLSDIAGYILIDADGDTDQDVYVARDSGAATSDLLYVMD